MRNEIKLIATDMDGTFLRSDNSYDVERFKKVLAHMKKNGCKFVVASGNQYYQLRDFFPGYYDELSFVAENGAFVKDGTEMIFAADIPKATIDFVIDVCRKYEDVEILVNGLRKAYVERSERQEFFDFMSIYCHQIEWIDDLENIDDQFLKMTAIVPDEKTEFYYEAFCQKLQGRIIPTTSGHGSIDLIVPGCHKASGLKRLTERWQISSEQCVAFGDGGNDIEMLQYCGKSYAMENAPQNVKDSAKYICESNDNDGVLNTLEKLFMR